LGDKLWISVSGVDFSGLWISFLLFDPGISLTFHTNQSGFVSSLDLLLNQTGEGQSSKKSE
jgi:hypothetical protein